MLAQLYMVLVDELVYLIAQAGTDLPIGEFHDIVDDALRPTA